MRITSEELKIIMIIYEDLKLRSYPTRMQLLGQMDKNKSSVGYIKQPKNYKPMGIGYDVFVKFCSLSVSFVTFYNLYS